MPVSSVRHMFSLGLSGLERRRDGVPRNHDLIGGDADTHPQHRIAFDSDTDVLRILEKIIGRVFVDRAI